MFSNPVSRLPLTDASASGFFTNINADSFEGDETFCATLRALLYNRLQGDESVNVRLDIRTKPELNPVVGIAAGMSVAPSQTPGHCKIYIRAIKGISREALDNSLKEAAHELSAFKEAPDISMYVSGSGCKAHVYMNEEKRQVRIFILNMNQKCWHKMQSAMPKLLPWYFTVPLDDNEKKLLYSLTQKSSNDYVSIISDYAKGFNFREDRLRKLLNGFGSSFEKQRHKLLLEEREQNIAQFEELQVKINKCIARERELLTDIAGLEAVIKQGGGMGLADYFICNKSLNLVGAKNDTLTYVVTTHLEYFDQHVFDKFFNTPNSYFYNNQGRAALEPETYKKLLLALYGDEACIRARTCAAFRLSLTGTLSALAQSEYLHDYDGWLPHPHIDGAHCMGTNTTHINQLMRDKKYIEAIEQSISSVKNINFADTTIAQRYLGSIKSSSQRFLELPSGAVVSPWEAAQWLNEREGV